MGAFVLFCRGADACEDRLSELFRRKGFSGPAVFDFKAGRLWYFAPQLVPGGGWVSSGPGSRLFCHGVALYKGLRLEAGLQALLKDWDENRVDESQLQGSFCLIREAGGQVELRVDRGGALLPYANRSGTVISSSLQAVLLATGGTYRLERQRLFELLMTGIIGGGFTLFGGVVKLVPAVMRWWTSRLVKRVIRVASNSEEGGFSGAEPCLSAQVEALRAYFGWLREAVSGREVTVGLSGGLDSRLLLALGLDVGLNIRPHSYVSGAHQSDSLVARELCRHAQLTLNLQRVALWDELDEEQLHRNIEDAIYYYDGTPNKSMGSFSDVCTRALRLRVLGGAFLGLNGLGGELYRDRESLRADRLSFENWLRCFVVGAGAVTSLESGRAWRELVEHLKLQYTEPLELSDSGRISRQQARLWYRNLWLPEAAGTRLRAESSLTHTVMPFADCRISSLALSGEKYLGRAGGLEARMIHRLNPVLASVPSAYGYSFLTIPVTARFKDWLKSLVPLAARAWRNEVLARKRTPIRLSRQPMSVPLLAEGLELLLSMGLPVQWDNFLSVRAQRDMALYLGVFLRRFEPYIRLN